MNPIYCGARRLCGSVLLLSAFAASMPVIAATHEHEHAHDESPPPAMVLPDPRWQTDAPLRQAMEHIRQQVLPFQSPHSRHHIDVLTARELAEAVRTQVAFMFAHCQLPPDADAGLHTLIASMLEGANHLSAAESDAEGITRIIDALQRYPLYFDHPGWSPLE